MHLNWNLQTTSNMISPFRTFPHTQNKKPKSFQWPKGHDLPFSYLSSLFSYCPPPCSPTYSSHGTSLLLFKLTKPVCIAEPLHLLFPPWNDFPPDICMASSSKSLLKYHLSKAFPRYLLWANDPPPHTHTQNSYVEVRTPRMWLYLERGSLNELSN